MGKQDLYISFFSIVGMSTFRKWTRYIRNGETSTTYQNLNGYLIHTHCSLMIILETKLFMYALLHIHKAQYGMTILV